MHRRGSRLAIVVPVALGITIALASSALGVVAVRSHVYSKQFVAAVSPRMHLGNGEYVQVSWRHVTPFEAVYFRQCDAHPKHVARDCTAIYNATGFTGSNGSGTTFQPVTEGEVLSQDHHQFVCDTGDPCKLAVLRSSALSTGQLIPIQFAPTSQNCPLPRGAAVAGGGADQSAIAIQAWSVVVCQPPQALGVNYIPANSLDGMTNFVKGLNDFAVTGVPLAAPQLHQLAQAGHHFKYAPLTASGLVLAYKVFDQDPARAEPGAQVTNLKLTPQLVAQIFTGQLTNWHLDATLNALNPGHDFPPTVWPLVRGDHSVANMEFTSWLSATAGSALPTGWEGPSFTYPLNYISQTGAIVGGDRLAQSIADPAGANLNADWFSAGYIGFVDSSQAAYYGLPTARIENASGHFVRATPAAVRAALSHATRDPDGVTVTPDYTTKDPAAYPMPMVDYATASTSHINPHRGYTLKQFLQYAATTGQKHLPRGYVPLPAGMVQETLSDLKEIPAVAPPALGGGSGGGTPYPSSGPGSAGGYSGGVGGSAGTGSTGSTPPPPISHGSGGVGHLLSSILNPGDAGATVPLLAALCLVGIGGGLLLERGWRRRVGALPSRMRALTARLPRRLAWRRP